MSAKDKIREEIDAAIARIDAKLESRQIETNKLQQERRDLEATRDKQDNSESG